jgi:hypothetical protein
LGAIIGGVVGGLILLALLIILAIFLLRRHGSKDTPPQTKNSAELPSYQDSKDAAAVEVSAGPLTFAEYRPREPLEMDASAGEEHDRFPVEGGAMPRISGSPRMGTPGRFSEVGIDGEQRSPGLRSESRVSEVSEGSVQVEEGRNSRLSGQTVTPRGSMVETQGSGGAVVRRKPVGA